MRTVITIAPGIGRLILPIFLLTGLVSVTATAQETRSLRIWVDTLEKPLCGEREFDNWGVWFESASESDTTLGFRLEDEVLTIEMTLHWDTSRVQLRPPYILDPLATLFGRFASKTQGVDTAAGRLYVTVSADPNAPRPAVGVGIPLFYLKGYVKDSDSTFGIPEGGARVQSFDILGTIGENVSTRRFLPGFVGIGPGEGPDFTGRLRVEAGDLDTNVRDTIALFAEGVGDRRLVELSFGLSRENDSIRFVEVLAPDAGDPWGWTTRQETVASERIDFAFEADRPIVGDETAPIVRVVVERTTDSGFSSRMVIDDVTWNRRTACLAAVETTADTMTGAPRRPAMVDTTDTTTSVATPSLPEGVRYENGVFFVDQTIDAVEIYDALGRRVDASGRFGRNSREIRVEMPVSGPIFAVIRTSDGTIEYVKKHYRVRE